MVAMCAGCDGYYPWAASLVAAIGAVAYYFTSSLMIKMKIDDPLDAVAVHAGAGLVGILLAPVFMDYGKFELLQCYNNIIKINCCKFEQVLFMLVHRRLL